MVQTLDVLATTDPRLHEVLASTFGLQQLLSSLPDYVTCLDPGLHIVMVNRVSAELDHVPVLGMHSSLFVPPLRRREYERLCRRVLTRGALEIFEFTSPRSLLVYESRMAPLRTTDGAIVGIVTTTTDVTEARRASRRADDALRIEREATRRLRELDELKNEFVAKVAHDLRTPITTIQGFADTMAYRWSDFDDDEKLRFLDYISQGTRQLMVLVEDILEVSNIESAEFRVELAEVDLARLLDVLAEHFAVITPTGRIVWSIPNDLPLVRADARRMTQVVTNLVSNALKFSDPETTIHVRAVTAEAGDHVQLSVTDAGIGIATSDLPRLFGKFVQLNSRTRPFTGGSGLGLYITRSLVEAQGGSIRIESELNIGTTVFVQIPVAHGSAGLDLSR
jgi:signal transduction histidine kinase